MDNLKSVAAKLLFIREGVNFACLMADTGKRAQAEALATAIAAGFLVPPAAVVIETALILCWAFAESVLDVRELFAGADSAGKNFRSVADFSGEFIRTDVGSGYIQEK